MNSGTLEVTNPCQPEGFVTLEILRSKTKTRIEYNGEKIRLKKIISIKTSIGEAQYNFQMTKEIINKVQDEAEKNIKMYSKRFFDEYKHKRIDIFNIADVLHRYYPKAKIENPIEISELDLDVEVHVEGSSNKADYH